MRVRGGWAGNRGQESRGRGSHRCWEVRAVERLLSSPLTYLDADLGLWPVKGLRPP